MKKNHINTFDDSADRKQPELEWTGTRLEMERNQLKDGKKPDCYLWHYCRHKVVKWYIEGTTCAV